MSASSKTRSFKVEDHPVFPQWKGRVILPVEDDVVERAEEEQIVGSGFENFLLNFGSTHAVPIPRRQGEFNRYVPLPAGGLRKGTYDFYHVSPQATLHPQVISNPPALVADPGSCPTTVSEAYDAMDKVWSEKQLAPLDWFTFAMLVNNQDIGENVRDNLVHQYRKLNKLLIVFSDKLWVGDSTKRVYIVWELVLKEGKIESMNFGLAEGHLTYRLADKEMMISICVPQEAVRINPDTEDWLPSDAVPFCMSTQDPGPSRTPVQAAFKWPTISQMAADPNWRATYGCPVEDDHLPVPPRNNTGEST